MKKMDILVEKRIKNNDKMQNENSDNKLKEKSKNLEKELEEALRKFSQGQDLTEKEKTHIRDYAQTLSIKTEKPEDQKRKGKEEKSSGGKDEESELEEAIKKLSQGKGLSEREKNEVHKYLNAPPRTSEEEQKQEDEEKEGSESGEDEEYTSEKEKDEENANEIEKKAETGTGEKKQESDREEQSQERNQQAAFQQMSSQLTAEEQKRRRQENLEQEGRKVVPLDNRVTEFPEEVETTQAQDEEETGTYQVNKTDYTNQDRERTQRQYLPKEEEQERTYSPENASIRGNVSKISTENPLGQGRNWSLYNTRNPQLVSESSNTGRLEREYIASPVEKEDPDKFKGTEPFESRPREGRIREKTPEKYEI